MAPYHAGELEVQARTGEFDQAVVNAAIVRTVVPPPLATFLSTLQWVILGGADARGAVWATALFGSPGFVHAAEDGVVRIEAQIDPGDPLAGLGLGPDDVGRAEGGGCGPDGGGTVGQAGVPIGLLAIDPARRFRARVNGRLSRHDDVLCVTAEQVYPNCMKYIQRRSLTTAVSTPTGAATRRSTRLSADDVDLLARADTFFIATLAPGADPGHGADVSHRGGRPGFIESLGGGTLRFADYRGNAMFNTLGNLELDPRAGLLVPDFDTGDLLQLTGRAVVDYEPEPAPAHPGARRIVRFSVAEAVRRPAASPLRSGAVEYSPFLPPRPVP